jgi:chromosomal replication initiator protein
MPLEAIWNKSLAIIEKKVGENAFELWFKPIKLSQLKDQGAVLEIPNRFFKDWVEDYYPTLIADTMEEVVGHPVTVKFKIAETIPFGGVHSI